MSEVIVQSEDALILSYKSTFKQLIQSEDEN
jgi:hypothetical protein